MMKLDGDSLTLSATDLANHAGCRHLTGLDYQVARELLERPYWNVPGLAALRERGTEHERRYVELLEGQGLSVVRIADDESGSDGAQQLLDAIGAGADAIVQAPLTAGRWRGRADVLRKVERASEFGPWSYEPVDTKLSSETRAGTILQLCMYAEILGEMLGSMPKYVHVVTPSSLTDADSYRVDDFIAYHRLVKSRLEATVEGLSSSDDLPTYPDPVAHCDVCSWWPSCDARRRNDDHLCLVAGISRLQMQELRSQSVETLELLGEDGLPLGWKPKRGSLEALARVREQARVQLEGRRASAPVYELLDPEPGRGLARLPKPSPGDVFFDIEGDPYVGAQGLEYLFGYAVGGETGGAKYYGCWALDAESERAAFEAFVDEIMARWKQFPEMHVYHYAPYEPGALKRLMGRYATREDEVDRMLRASLFVDLYNVARQGVRASVEQYSIKDLELFYDFEREAPLDEAGKARHAVECALELGDAESAGAGTRTIVELYNRDDCVSALALRGWLESLRAELEATGEKIERPEIGEGAPSEALDERQQRVRDLMEALAADVPADVAERTPEEHGRWILAQILEWHRREQKAVWWEYFRLQELDDEELLEEKAAISGLSFEEALGGTARNPIERYSFPKQDTSVREGDDLRTTDGEAFGKVVAIDLLHGTVDIKKRGAMADEHPTAVFSHTVFPTRVLEDALFRIGQWVAKHGVDARGKYRAARDLLLNLEPRLKPRSTALREKGELPLDAAKRLGLRLDRSVLAIQGPPGAGKTYTAAHMICELVRAGKRVGITAVSHKVIENLLLRVVRIAGETGANVSCARKVSQESDDPNPDIEEHTKNDDILEALEYGTAQVAAGTAWLWSREEFCESVDVLFIDEAGQFSLANALAVAQAAKSLVMLGDPQQLDQPQQGSHPDGTGGSALEHILGGKKTISPDHGIFLAETWRLHPAICDFTSSLFYEGKLTSRPELANQSLTASAPCPEPGLWWVPVEHEGNQNSSPEEVDQVARLFELLVREGVGWIDNESRARQMTAEDVLIIAPYNVQVADLAERLPGARVGTVDKFQGQEAPVVIYSMATSTPEDAPRGMEFLYSLNRLNVATSRARCACVLVANPRLFEPECRHPRQMQLANAFCRYRELARIPEGFGFTVKDACSPEVVE